MQRLVPISPQSIIERLQFENPWWVSGEIDPLYEEMHRRLYFDVFFPLVQEVDVRRALVLMGPRRVGKTVMLYHSISKLLKDGKNPQKVCFIGVDNPLYLNIGLEELFKLGREAAGNPDPRGWFVFFDEVQYLKNWEQHLKVLTDSYPHTKFIVSGSAAAALKYKSTESGAGRFTEFLLPPLTFHEYIHLKNYESLMRESPLEWMGVETNIFTTVNMRELNEHFLDYINFGGYPEVIFSEKIRSDPTRYIKGDIIDKVLLRDLPSLYGIKDVQELNAFFTTLVYYTGCEVSLESLCKSSGVDKVTIKKYLEYLEAAFLIKSVRRIDDNAKRFQRMNFFKVYLTNPSLRSALFAPVVQADEVYGNLVETAIFAQWLHRDKFEPYYARWKSGRIEGEVDMVRLDSRLKPEWAVEIKSSNRAVKDPSEIKGLLRFCELNNLKSALLTTYDQTTHAEIEGKHIQYYPAALYAYTVGSRTLDEKKTGF